MCLARILLHFVLHNISNLYFGFFLSFFATLTALATTLALAETLALDITVTSVQRPPTASLRPDARFQQRTSIFLTASFHLRPLSF